MKLKTFIQTKKRELARRKKQLKRKAFILKLKIFFLWVLPVVIVLLAVKTLQTLLRVRLRSQAAAVPLDSREDRGPEPVIKPVTQTSSKPEFVTPVPVSQKS